jgi:hypothetical protein
MKFLLVVTIFSSILFSSARLEHVTIGNQDFSITTETYKIYDSKGEVMRFYKEERNNDLTFIFNLILEDATGTCADKSMQSGYYEINGTNITLYSFWDRKGKSYDSPYGARIQHYEMLPDHTVVLKSSRLYIETARRNYDESSGMKYLFTSPQSKNEKEAFSKYIKSVEREYNGVFVFGDDAKKLIDEVHDALNRKMRTKWK